MTAKAPTESGGHIQVVSLGFDYTVLFGRLLQGDRGVAGLAELIAKALGGLAAKCSMPEDRCCNVGSGDMGKLLCDLLRDHSSLSVDFFVEWTTEGRYRDVPVVTPGARPWPGVVFLALPPGTTYLLFQILKSYPPDRDCLVVLVFAHPLLAPFAPASLDLGEVDMELPAYYGESIRRAASSGRDLWPQLMEEGAVDMDWCAKFMNRTVLPLLRRDSTVLEIGPGTGQYTRFLMKALPQGELHLFEVARWWQDYLRQSLAGLSPCRVHVHRQVADSFPGVRDACVDMVLAMGVFVANHISMVSFFSYMAESARVLKPGGWLIFNMHDSDDAAAAVKALHGYVKSGKSFPEFRSKRIIDALLAQNGVMPREDLHQGEYLVYQKIGRKTGG